MATTLEIVASADSAEISGYSTVRSLARTSAEDHRTDGVSRSAAISSDNALYFYYRYFLRFPVSLPAGSTIVSAKIRMTPTGIENTPSSGSWNVDVCTCNWGAFYPVTSANRQGAYTLSVNAPTQANWGSIGNLVIGTPRLTGALNHALIPTNGAVYYVVRTSYDISNVAFGKNENKGIRIATPSHGTAAWRPTLVLEYLNPVTPSQVFLVGV